MALVIDPSDFEGAAGDLVFAGRVDREAGAGDDAADRKPDELRRDVVRVLVVVRGRVRHEVGFDVARPGDARLAGDDRGEVVRPGRAEIDRGDALRGHYGLRFVLVTVEAATAKVPPVDAMSEPKSL